MIIKFLMFTFMQVVGLFIQLVLTLLRIRVTDVQAHSLRRRSSVALFADSSGVLALSHGFHRRVFTLNGPHSKDCVAFHL